MIFTGGTISMVADAAADGKVPTLDGAAILARAPGIEALADLVPIDLGRTPASHFSFEKLFEIAGEIRRCQADPAIDGVVVVQGTDVIDETAFLWDLVLDGAAPVVVTGAMRAASDANDDGPENLRNAVRCAASPAMRGSGVCVALDGTINDRVPIRWVLDTGATMSSIPRDVATRLDAKVVGSQKFKLADGTITTKQVILIKKISIGGTVSVVNIKASVGPAGTAALLGKNFLDAFSSYEINNKQAQLVLRK